MLSTFGMSLTWWVWSCIVSLYPNVAQSWDIADGIATASQESPLYDGDDGPARTAALLVAIARFESTFKVRAYNPHDKTRSFGLFQTPQALTPADPRGQSQVAIRLLRHSLALCHSLALYTSGRCDRGIRAAHARQALADRLRAGLY